MKKQINNNTFLVIFSALISIVLLPLIYTLHATEIFPLTSGLSQSPIRSEIYQLKEQISELKNVMEQLKTNSTMILEVLKKTQSTTEESLETYKEFEQAFNKTLNSAKMFTNIMQKIQLVLVDRPSLKTAIEKREKAKLESEDPSLTYKGLESVEKELKDFINQMRPDPKKAFELFEKTMSNFMEQFQTSSKILFEVLEKATSDEKGQFFLTHKSYERFEMIRCNITNNAEKLLDTAIEIVTVLFPKYSVELRLRTVIEKLKKDSARIIEMLDNSLCTDPTSYSSMNKEKFENIYTITMGYNTKITRIVQYIRDYFDTSNEWLVVLDDLIFNLSNISSLLVEIFQNNLFCIEIFELSFVKTIYRLIRINLSRSNEIAQFILDYFLIISTNPELQHDPSLTESLQKLYDSIKNALDTLSRFHKEVETSVSESIAKQEEIEQRILEEQEQKERRFRKASKTNEDEDEDED